MSLTQVTSGAIIFAAGLSSGVMAQVPERRPQPPARSPGTLTPAVSPGTLDPPRPPGGLNPAPTEPAMVRPGTIQGEPTLVPSRELVYLAPGEAPGNVRVVATAPRSVTLEWSAPNGAYAYWVHQAQGGTYYRGGQSTTETTFEVTRLLPNTTYSFKVSATYPQEMQRGEGMSGAVTAMTAAAPAPTGLTASVVGRGKVNLSWDGLPGADGFRLFRNGAVLSDIKPVGVTQGGPEVLRTTFSDSVHPGAYRYQIQAVYRSGSNAPGAETVSALAPTTPVVVTFKAFIFCQTRMGSDRCAEPDPASVTISARTPLRGGGRSPS